MGALGGHRQRMLIRFCILWRRGRRISHVAGVFVQIPLDLVGDVVRATLRFELANVAVEFAGEVNSCPCGRYAASAVKCTGIELVLCPPDRCNELGEEDLGHRPRRECD